MHPASVGSNVSQNEDCLLPKYNRAFLQERNIIGEIVGRHGVTDGFRGLLTHNGKTLNDDLTEN